MIIDPQLTWATLYGGSGADGPMSVDTDANGNVFVTGYADDNGGNPFPLQAWGGAFFSTTPNMGTIIMRFDPNGALIWSTRYGSGRGHFIKCDPAGNIYIAGYQRVSFMGGVSGLSFATGSAYVQDQGGGNSDAFIMKFDNNGIRLWATYYGGGGDEEAHSLDLDQSGNIYVVGKVRRSFAFGPPNLFPLLPLAGAYNDNTLPDGVFDAFILKFTSSGERLWATFLGGDLANETAYSVVCDGMDNVYVTGEVAPLSGSTPDFPVLTGSGYNKSTYAGGNTDAFITKFNSAGAMVWSTYYGGNGIDAGMSLACDSKDNVYVVGHTRSSAATFTTVPLAGAYNRSTPAGNVDIFILKFDNTEALTWATYYGGSGDEIINSSFDNISIDACDNVYIAFETASSNILTTANTSCGDYLDASYNQNRDNFLIKFDAQGALKWATYFGGNRTEFRKGIAVDKSGILYLVGEWTQNGGVINPASYPLLNPGNGAYYDGTHNGLDDGFIAKFIPTPPTYVQSQTDPTGCACDGEATVTIDCGNPNYSYVWSHGVQVIDTTVNTHTVTGLCPGTYTVTVTSNCLIDTTLTYIIPGSTGSIALTLASANPTCGNNDGIATVIPITGTAPIQEPSSQSRRALITLPRQ